MPWLPIDRALTLGAAAGLLSALAALSAVLPWRERRLIARLQSLTDRKLESFRSDLERVLASPDCAPALDIPPADAPPCSRTRVLLLLGEGYELSDIAAKLGLRRAEVDLLLKMRVNPRVAAATGG